MFFLKTHVLLSLLFIINWTKHSVSIHFDPNVIGDYLTRTVKTTDVIIFTCSKNDLRNAGELMMNSNQKVQLIDLSESYNLRTILTRKNCARTSVVVNTVCNGSTSLLGSASSGRYFNKTYQWVLWDMNNDNIEKWLPLEFDYIGPNSQITYINRTSNGYMLWDIHSMGRHLKSNLKINLVAIIKKSHKKNKEMELQVVNDIIQLQGIKYRGDFQLLQLRGASVIDQDNVTTNDQIERILSRPIKDSGVAAFIKYHYELLRILRERLNFTVNFRNSRGWAGRLGSANFRLGFLGIIQRNEADIGASGSFNRINRFAEFDTIHQSWKFETAFLYRFTPDLSIHGKSGNFLAPFNQDVWVLLTISLFIIILFWWVVEFINYYSIYSNNEERYSEVKLKTSKTMLQCVNETSVINILIQIIAAVCQQGMEPIPRELPLRTIILTVFIFSLVIYNFYTSSVVGGLLISTSLGPSSVEEIVSSSLKISFEDIGYYKVLFRENKSPIVSSLLKKLSVSRSSNEIPVYTHIENAVPYLKKGGFAYHCEVVDAYPEILKSFEINEICDLRVVSGLMEVELMNWIIHKNSQYSEIFKVVMSRAGETGIVKRLLQQRQPKKPKCQSLYTVYPVNLVGVRSAFLLLLGGAIISILMLVLEVCLANYFDHINRSNDNLLN